MKVGDLVRLKKTFRGSLSMFTDWFGHAYMMYKCDIDRNIVSVVVDTHDGIGCTSSSPLPGVKILNGQKIGWIREDFMELV